MDPISQYQQWKQQGESLRAQAKQAMETRFRELLAEAAQIAQEYHRDFGSALKPPPAITAFRYKMATAKAKKASKGAPLQRKEAPVVSPATPPNPKIAALEKQRAQIQKKIEAVKGAGKPTKNLEDRLYEIEDELRLAGHVA